MADTDYTLRAALHAAKEGGAGDIYLSPCVAEYLDELKKLRVPAARARGEASASLAAANQQLVRRSECPGNFLEICECY